jgi:Zn-dependent protease
VQTAIACVGCGHALSPALLSCPACHRLVHADRLRALAATAAAQTADRPSDALGAWREARELLPAGSRQRTVIDARIVELSKRVDAGATATTQRPRGGWGSLAATGALVASKAKLFLVGLTKASTLLSMLLAFGVYWTAWGWRFAAGFVGSIFVHEMGHVSALRRFGIRATLPMFLPGIGAVVRVQQGMAPSEEARVGLAGPLWGCGAAIVALAVSAATASPLWAAIAHTGAWVNLFNLLPIVPLDGGRGFRALDRSQRLATLPAIAAAWYATGEGLLVLLLLVAAARSFESTATHRDPKALTQYVGLVLVLSLVLHLGMGAATP